MKPPTEGSPVFPKTLPIVALVGALVAHAFTHPGIVMTNRVSMAIGAAIGWSILAFVGYWVAGRRESWAPARARVAWVLLALSVLVELLKVIQQ